ncbi:dihydroorotate dehydrogenase electron transfer subunit [Piscibacillus sp. B03]|uniref:dihydroorotate dehydrogenase electron transfer subunit n=1 Tax=Piscibacillus sp. B03 TaxID=3457430 RepID=UPI003FCE3DCD
MIQELMKIKSNQLIAFETYELIVEGALVQQIQQPGQFVHMKIGEGNAHMLRRPFSIADYDYETNELVIIYKVIGDGTKWLSERHKGELLNVLGPIGNGFDIKTVEHQHILVVGGGVGVPPLYNLVKQLSSFNKVTAILGYQSKGAVFYETNFNRFAETYIATDDGTYGFKGLVTEAIDQLELPIDSYYSCGPLGMLRAVQHKLDKHHGYLSVEERMGCGVGACFACVCQADNDKGYVKICQDGPVFSSSEVTL